MHKRRSRGQELTLDKPLPAKPEFRPAPRKNIITEALKIREYLRQDSSRSFRHAAEHFGISRARVSQLMRMLKHLPGELIDQLKDCQDPEILRKFSGRKLLNLRQEK
jgi:hypothetical protein